MDEGSILSTINEPFENEGFSESSRSCPPKPARCASDTSTTPASRMFRRIKREPVPASPPKQSGDVAGKGAPIPLSHTISTTSTTDDMLYLEGGSCSEKKFNDSSLDSQSVTSSPTSTAIDPGLAAILHCLDFSAAMTARLVETFSANETGSVPEGVARKLEIEGQISKGRTSVVRSYSSQRIKDSLSSAREEWKKQLALADSRELLLSEDESDTAESSSENAESVNGDRNSIGEQELEESGSSDAQSRPTTTELYPRRGSPISTPDDWSPPELKEYQLVGVQWLLALHEDKRYGVLADEMGLGKTAQTICFLSILYSTGKILKTSIIFCPATLLDNWMNEFGKFAPHLRVMKYHGNLKSRRKLIKNFEITKNRGIPYHVLVVSAQAIGSSWDKSLFFKKHQFGYLIVDEAHSLKNAESQIYRNLKRSLNSERRLLLTGSPIQNDLGELQNLLAILLPRGLEPSILALAVESYGAHRGELALQGVEAAPSCHIEGSELQISGKQSPQRDPNLSHQVEFLQNVFAPFILRRLKTEVIHDLPPKTTIIERCIIDGRQRELYVNAISDVDTELAKELAVVPIPPEVAETKNDIYPDVTNIEVDQADGLAATVVQVGVSESNDSSHMGACNSPKRPLLKLKPKSKQFIQNLTFRLRRICNHPLLLRGFYTHKEVEAVINYYHKNVEGFKGQPYERVADEIQSWSDYEIHQALGDLGEESSLQCFRIPQERLLESAKIRRMLQIVQAVKARGSKVLVFSQFTTFLDVIEETLTLHTPDVIFLRLDGATLISERQAMVDRFATDPDVTLFLLSTKAGGVGLNLTAADTVLLMDQGWNPHCERQAEDRVHRLGQTKPVTIYRLCCKETLEESILRCAQRKLFLDEAFGGKSDLLSAAVLKDCLSSSLARNEVGELHKRNGAEEMAITIPTSGCGSQTVLKPGNDTTPVASGRSKAPKARIAVVKRSRGTDVNTPENEQPKRSKKVRSEEAPTRRNAEPSSTGRSKVATRQGQQKDYSKSQVKTSKTKRSIEATTRNALLHRFSSVKPAATIR